MDIIKDLEPLTLQEISILTDIKVSRLKEFVENKKKLTKNQENKLIELSKIKDFPFKNNNGGLKFIDLFSGIGGFRLGFQQKGHQCVFSSEWDDNARKTYYRNFGKVPNGDITQIQAVEIPDHDVLLAGFPCQSFSQAGMERGFNDTRGTMFFEVQRILSVKRPKSFILENVKNLMAHDKKRTFNTILNILKGENDTDIPDEILSTLSKETKKALETKLNYWIDYKVLSSRAAGLPQNRQRVYIVGFDLDQISREDIEENWKWPSSDIDKDLCFQNILEKNVDDCYTLSNRLWEGHKRRKEENKKNKKGFGCSVFLPSAPYVNTLTARYYKDGAEILVNQDNLNKNPRKITEREAARLQGFPDNYIIKAVSRNQLYKQMGNAVSVPVISELATCIKKVLK